MILNSNKCGAESKAMFALIKKVVNTELWKVCKFIKNKDFHYKACMVVLRKLQLREMEGLEDEELEAAQQIWVEAHKSQIASLLNERRNYVIQQLGKEVRDHVVKGKLDELPTVEEMRKLVNRDGMDADVPKEEKARMDPLFDKYWDVLIPIVAGNQHWAPKYRWHSQLSFAKREPGNPDSQPLVHPSDEAFLLIAWENSYSRWVYKATAKDEFDEKDPRAKTKYSSSSDGIKAYGQWDPQGIRACKKVTDKVAAQRLPDPELDDPEAIVNFIRELESQALDRIRKANKITDDGPPKKKSKTSTKVNAFDGEECDMDDDNSW